jgi:Cd2+/Zn2+-exporting ATPase
MEHKHIYDAQGKQLCCTQTEKIYTNAGAAELVKEH